MAVTLDANYQATVDDDTLSSDCPVHGTPQGIHQRLSTLGLVILDCGHVVQILPYSQFGNGRDITWTGSINGSRQTLTLTTQKYAPYCDVDDTIMPFHIVQGFPEYCEVEPKAIN